MVRKTELKIAALVSEHSQGKRALNKLYAGLVTVVLNKKATGTAAAANAAAGAGAGAVVPARGKTWVPSAALQLRLGRRINAIAATPDPALYARYVRDVHRALAARPAADRRAEVVLMSTDSGGRIVDINTPLCNGDLLGKCTIPVCPASVT
jgi:hypothetical protein